MKEDVLELLMYLFEAYIYDEPEAQPDRDSLELNLLMLGFTQGEIDRAFHWLDELAEQRHAPELVSRCDKPLRLFTAEEMRRLDTESRGFIMYLENIGVLDPALREVVIDRMLALDNEEIGLEDLKWVILIVLFNQPGQEANYAWMEDMMFEEVEEYKH